MGVGILGLCSALPDWFLAPSAAYVDVISEALADPGDFVSAIDSIFWHLHFGTLAFWHVLCSKSSRLNPRDHPSAAHRPWGIVRGDI